jgi:alpha-glucosidase
MSDLRSQILHPDALFDSPYQAHQLDLSGYRPVEGPWSLAAQDATGVTLVAKTAKLCVEGVGDGAIRLRLNPCGDITKSVTESLDLITIPPATSTMSAVKEAGNILITVNGLVLSVACDTGALTLSDASGAILMKTQDGVRFAQEAGEYSGHRFILDLDVAPGEKFFGCGGRSAKPDRTQSTFDCFAQKVGMHTGDYGGFPIPWFLSSRGHGIFLNNPWPHLYADFAASDANRWWIHAPGGAFDIFVFRGPEWADSVGRFTQVVGRTPIPERWWLGFWVSALGFGTANAVESTVARLRQDGVPLDAVVVDGPWRGGPEFLKKYMSEGEYPTNDINWHPDFGDGPGMVRRLAQQGIRTVLHQNSRAYLAETNARGEKEGFLRRSGREVVPHFANAVGKEFYRQQILPRFAEGVALWWLDHGDRVSGEFAPGIPSRNLFGAVWAHETANHAKNVTGKDQMVLIRGSGIGSQRHTLPWPGDTRYGLDHAEQDLWFCLSAGLSGFSITSFDLGGFYRAGCTQDHESAFDEENICRRLAQALLYVPNARVHGDDSAPPKVPHHCQAAARSLYRRMLCWRYRLLPWFHHWAQIAHKTGAPVLRHLGWHYRKDSGALNCHDQCLLGDNFLVAPVFTRGASSRRVYLPAGHWYNFWTGEHVTGPGDQILPAPLHEPEGLPIFVKAGTALPLQDELGGAGENPPDSLHWDLYPSAQGRFDLMESETLITPITWQDFGDRLEVEIQNTLSIPRAMSVRVHLDTLPGPIFLGGRLAPLGERHDEPARQAVRQRLTLAPGAKATLVFHR